MTKSQFIEKKGEKMKKTIALSLVTVLATTMYASSDTDTKIAELEAKLQKLEKKLQSTNKTLTNVKIHDGQDDIKWDVDFRTAFDSIHYKHASGKESSNPDLLTNRLWLGMGYNPNDNTIFKGKLSYMKAYGDSMNHSQANTQPGYANFDWVTNENATDNTVKVKEAYWLYMNDTFMGSQVPWTISIGRRPSTDGLGINMREGMKDNSPLSHTVNVEFDGLSSRFNLDKVTGVSGMWWKLCTGRGLTNAKPRFQMDGTDYAADTTGEQTKDVNMYGFIFVPYDNGQYSVHTNWARAEHLIGYDKASTYEYMGFSDTELTNMLTAMGSPYTAAQAGIDNNSGDGAFKDVGDMDLFTVMFKAEGIGDGINDFLDDTRFFASWAQSKTNPRTNFEMLGSTKSETGTSTWLGVNMPCPLTDNGRIGFEWNKGSKYWRSVTYAEDTMTGSKIAARGTAVEAYYTKPINNALSFNLRYTKIDYDYTGSNAFFGSEGAPMSWDEVAQYTQMGMSIDPVKESSDFRASISYRF
jgi:hypothetical protein